MQKALQRELGFNENEHVPLVGFIGRLDWQKGPDLIQDAVHNHRLLEQDIQMVMLGSGDPGMEEWMAWAVRGFSTASLTVPARRRHAAFWSPLIR